MGPSISGRILHPPSTECQITEPERVRVCYYFFPPEEELLSDWLMVQEADALITEIESEDNLQTPMAEYKDIF